MFAELAVAAILILNKDFTLVEGQEGTAEPERDSNRCLQLSGLSVSVHAELPPAAEIPAAPRI